jgi:S1-C subfamily serine protease
VVNITALTRAVSDISAGETATFTIFRDGKQQDIKVKIEERSNEVAADNGKLWPGLYVLQITEELRKEVELDKNISGLYVANVTDKSPAKILGVQRDDLITSINGVKVTNLAAFYKVLREQTSKELYFEIKRGDNTLETAKFKR